jgi:hypothetical protein
VVTTYHALGVIWREVAWLFFEDAIAHRNFWLKIHFYITEASEKMGKLIDFNLLKSARQSEVTININAIDVPVTLRNLNKDPRAEKLRQTAKGRQYEKMMKGGGKQTYGKLQDSFDDSEKASREYFGLALQSWRMSEYDAAMVTLDEDKAKSGVPTTHKFKAHGVSVEIEVTLRSSSLPETHKQFYQSNSRMMSGTAVGDAPKQADEDKATVEKLLAVVADWNLGSGDEKLPITSESMMDLLHEDRELAASILNEAGNDLLFVKANFMSDEAIAAAKTTPFEFTPANVGLLAANAINFRGEVIDKANENENFRKVAEAEADAATEK